MSTFVESYGKLYLKEIHSYRVELGQQTQITWLGGTGKVSLYPPYDLNSLYTPDSNAPISLGILQITPPNGATPLTKNITVPAYTLSHNPLHAAQRVVWTQSYDLTEPQELALSVRGEVRDELTPSSDQNDDAVWQFFKDSKSNPHALALQLEIWVADLYRSIPGKSQQYQLEEMLRQREHRTQVLIPTLEDHDRLARNLVALANNAEGGRILIGVERNGQVKKGLLGSSKKEREQTVAEALLKATLQTTPCVPFSTPDYFIDPEGAWIARLEIPGGSEMPYRIHDTIYRRTESQTWGEKVAIETKPDSPVKTTSDVEALFQRENRKDIIKANAGGRLEEFDLGAQLSGLINAGEPSGIIFIYNLSREKSTDKTLRNQLEKLVKNTLTTTNPSLTQNQIGYRIATLTKDNESEYIAVVEYGGSLPPFLQVSQKSYLWEKGKLQELSGEAALNRYLSNIRDTPLEQAEGEVQLTYSELLWPVQPLNFASPSQKASMNARHARYEPQLRAMIWDKQSLNFNLQLGGSTLTITTPLEHALTSIDESGYVTIGSPLLTGKLKLRYTGVLLSGTTVDIKSNNIKIDAIPRSRETEIHIELVINANQLFQQREHVTLMRYYIPDVILDEAELIGLQRVCNDLGFQLKTDIDQIKPDTSHNNPILIDAYRTDQFCDLSLLIHLSQEKVIVERELQYPTRKDRKQTTSITTVVWVRLGGKGMKARAEIGKLQIALYELLSNRLPYLQNE